MAITLEQLFDARRVRLATWITAHFGLPVEFQKHTKINQGLLSALLKEGGSKSFGEKMALRLETLAQAVDGKPVMPTGYLLNPFGDSQAMRLDTRILGAAISVARDAKGGLSIDKIVTSYELLMARAANSSVQKIDELPSSISPSEAEGNDTVAGGDSGAVEDHRRESRSRKK